MFNKLSKEGSAQCKVIPIIKADHNYLLMPSFNPDVNEYVARKIVPEDNVLINSVIIPRGEWVPRPSTRDELMTIGVEFQGVMCSLHAEDMWGLSAAKPYILAGQSFNYHFKNGTKLLLTPDNIAAFEAVWLPARIAFFPIEE